MVDFHAAWHKVLVNDRRSSVDDKGTSLKFQPSATQNHMDFIRKRRHLSVFGHIARLTQGTPAHKALHCQVSVASGRSLGGDWRRRPGRPRARWTDQLRNDTGSVPANPRRHAILRGRNGAMRWCELATR